MKPWTLKMNGNTGTYGPFQIVFRTTGSVEAWLDPYMVTTDDRGPSIGLDHLLKRLDTIRDAILTHEESDTP